jgi:hypothetical protein
MPQLITLSKSVRDSKAHLFIALSIAIGVAAVFLFLVMFASTLRARLNLVQGGAVLFFFALGLRCLTAATPVENADETDAHPWGGGLWLSLVVGGVVWAVMVPFYFIGDDFEHLARAAGPLIAGLWDLTIHGQLGAFLRPVGFATIFLDYRLYGLWPPGYHITNLVIHLGCIAGVYSLCVELGLGSRIAPLASLIFSVLPIETEAVAWMGARFDLLSTFFTLWGVVFYLRYRWNASIISAYVIALLCFALALLSKENAYMFPLLLLAIECLVMSKRSWKALTGCCLLAVVLFVYRGAVLGGIGGYVSSGNGPIALHISFKAVEGLFLRAPSLLLFGYNWAQPRLATSAFLFSANIGLLLALVILSKFGTGAGKRLWLGLVWMIVPLLPAHPFLMLTADLRTSRVLYMGAVGMSMVLSQIIGGIPSPHVRFAAAGFLVSLFSAGVVHNLGDWRLASLLEQQFLVEIKHVAPSPPLNAEFVFYDMPMQVRGIDFHVAGLADAIRIVFRRSDLAARRAEDASGSDHLIGRREIRIQWRRTEGSLISLLSSK